MGVSLVLWTVKLSIFRLFGPLVGNYFAGAFVFFKWANLEITVIEKYRLCVL